MLTRCVRDVGLNDFAPVCEIRCLQQAFVDLTWGARMTCARLGAATLALVAILAFVSGARADYEAGAAAWEEGRHAEARKEWLAAAEAGDPRSMLALGRLYLVGVGAPQDYVEAHKWLNLAAGLGEPEAVAERDTLAQEMTAEERAEARKLARVWRPSSAREAEPETASDGEADRTEAPASADPLPAGALREAQALLAALGYAPGPADGIWGNRSMAAYRTFLRDAGLPTSDEPTMEAMDILRAIAERYDADAPVASPPAEDTAATAAVPADAALRAAKAGDIEGLAAALEGGSDPNVRDNQGWTALMHAANEGYSLLIPALLDAGAEVDARAADGATALFIAALHGDASIVAALMKAGADVSVRGPRGKTAVDLARSNWGEPGAAGQQSVDPAILALVKGKSWTDAEHERLQQERAEQAERNRQEEERLAHERAKREWLAGKEFRDCTECPEMVVVPAGSFVMGSPADAEMCDGPGGPQPRVTFAAPFAVGKYEVTFAEWDACVAAGGCNGYRPDDEGWGRELRPAINLIWDDAKAYVRWLSRVTGERYRLLSEAEWEYAARAGTRTPFHTGRKISPDQANYDGRYYGSDRRVYREKTMPVGSFPANPFGLHDMHGNASEWVEDCWNMTYQGAPFDGSAWERGDCSTRIRRGGSWDSLPWNTCSASRFPRGIGFREDGGGFRVARTLTR